jgi:hypothetical protein
VIRSTLVLLVSVGVISPRPLLAAELTAGTIAAFDRYVSATEARMAPAEPFLWVDGLPEARRRTALETLRRGEFVIEPLTTKENGRSIHVPDGLIHHWIGVVLAPGVTVDQAVALMQDYDHHGEIYKPNVVRSKLLGHSGDDFRLFLRFKMKKGITVVVNGEHEAHFTRLGPERAMSRIHSTRIAEVEDPDTPQEKELPEGRDGGYLWRLNSYWRFLQRPEGVYIQCESITLTRGIPYGLGWLVGPFVTSLPRETLAFTLEATRKALLARTPVKPASP